MAKICTLTFINEVFTNVTGLDKKTNDQCINKLKYLVPWRFHTPSFKLGRWDGSIRLYTDNGRVYSSLLPDIVPIIIAAGYELDIVDKRVHGHIDVPKIDKNIFADNLWPKGHKFEGQPILLRDDQVEAANIFSDYRYAIQELSTGYGKCLEYSTLIPVFTEDASVANSLGIVVGEKDQVAIGKIFDCFTGTDKFYKESPVSEGALFVYTPDGEKTPVNFVIKKHEPTIKITFEDGDVLVCADGHILSVNGESRTAIQVFDGGIDSIDTNSGRKKIKTIECGDRMSVYDISIDAPHWYVDAVGIIHHNTILTAAICKQVEHLGRTLTIVPSISLVGQTKETMDLVNMDVSVYFSTEKNTSGKHVITTWQSLAAIVKDKNKNEAYAAALAAMKKDLIQITVDECHGAKSDVLDKILSTEFSNIPLRRGFTGTMPPEEFFTKTVIGNIGEIVHRVAARDLQEQGFLAECFVHCIINTVPKAFDDYATEYSYLTENFNHLSTLVPQFTSIAESGNTLILVDRVQSGEYLQSLIPNSYFVSGGTKDKKRKEVYKLASENDGLVIIATYGVAAVGIDIPRLYNVVLLESGKSFIRIIQSVGRGLRVAKDKKHANIWDFSSSTKFSRKHAKERLKYYSGADYPFREVTGSSDQIIEYILEQIQGKQDE